MKKIIILLSVAIAALAVSCNKVTPQDSTPDAPKGEKITITVSLSDALSKVSLTQDPEDPDGAIKVAWEATDKIFVIDANNPNNFEAFSIVAGSIDTEKPYTATFEGTAPDASSFNILYGATSVSAANSFNSEQTQTGNASTDHLQYKALISGVSSIENIEFSKTWAETNGGSFSQNGALRFRIQVPAEVTSVASVSLKAPSEIFSGSETIKVKFNASVEPVNGIITAYAMLPMGDAIEVAEGNFVLTIETAEEIEYNKTFSPGSISFKPGQTNAIKLNKNGFTNNLFAGGSGIEGDPYLIATAEHMQNMHIVMKDNAVIYFKMIDDIDMTDVEWVSLNNSGSFSKGINFDGDNHTILNLSVSSGSYPSFFGVLNGTVENVTFETPEINGGNNNSGVIGGYIGTSSEGLNVIGICRNVTVINAIVSGTAGSKTRNYGIFAGVIANANSSIDNCHVKGENTKVTQSTTSYNGCSVGGFIGNISAAATISNCTAQADATNVGSYYTGGFIGTVTAAAKITNCAYNGGNVSASRNNTNSPVGGFVGRADNTGASFIGCHVNLVTISASVCGRTGCFVGEAGQNTTFTSCSVTNSSISGGINTAGFGGVFYGKADKCFVDNTTITANNTQVGGFAGYPENATITNCYITSTVSIVGNSYNEVGGFLGRLMGGTTITSCYEATIIDGTGTKGAFIGNVQRAPSSITNNVAWNESLPLYGAIASGVSDANITNNYIGTEETVTAQALALNWDTTIWNLSGDFPTLK